MSFINQPQLSSLGSDKNGAQYALSFSFNFSDEDDVNILPPGFIAAIAGYLLALTPASYTNNIAIPTFRSIQFSMIFNQGTVSTTRYLDGDYVISNPTTGQTLRFGQPPYLPEETLPYANAGVVSGLVPFILNSASTLNIYKTAAGSGSISTDSVITITLFTLPLDSYILSGYSQGDNL